MPWRNAQLDPPDTDREVLGYSAVTGYVLAYHDPGIGVWLAKDSDALIRIHFWTELPAEAEAPRYERYLQEIGAHQAASLPPLKAPDSEALWPQTGR